MADEEKDKPKDISPEINESDAIEFTNGEEQNEVNEPVGDVTDETIDQIIVDPNIGTLKPRDLAEEMQTSYLSYAMSVIVSRALPDVRDGMKPVHRRVLYAMHDIGLRANAKYRKSATVVGEVLGKYHPHGDTAVYDTMVRMAQDFSMRYPLVDGQGNFGSMDGDGAAAMRYTEAKMTKMAEEMLLDIDKDTVDWADNYDGSRQEPLVLPARIPQLLLNGSMGIAVGMATNIPPHNLNELCDGIIHLIDHPEASVEDIMEFIKGPDFPTGGIIYNKEDIKTAYATGKGKIVMRAKAGIEEAKRGFRIIITEIPYQVNKATLIEKIADLVKEKKIDGISDLRDESDRRGVRVVIELKSSAFPKKVLNRLYELTQMQTAFHVNMLALTPELEPRVMTVLDVLSYYIEHRREVITRRTKFELAKAKDRAHILEGLKIALDHIDEVINTIRASANRDEAKKNLIAKFSLSEKQADAILEMRLSALAALERQRIEDEYNQLVKFIEYLEDLLANPQKILGLVKDDLNDVKEKYGDARRTEIVPYAIGEFRAEDVIPNQQVIVSLSRGNYIKRQEVDTYHKQIRGGVGVVGMATKEEDIVDHLACCYSHDDIYFFTNKGRVFKSKVYELPATSRQSKGTPVVNIIQIGPEEKVTSLLTISEKNKHAKFFIMGTKKGIIKRTEIEKYDNIRKTGIIAIGLKDKDELKWVKSSVGEDTIVEVSEKGLAICYRESDVRPMGRSASGVTGMKLRSGDFVMSMDVIPKDYASFEGTSAKFTGPDMLIVLENGFGKRTMVKHFHLQKRGGMGIKAANCTPKTGNVIGMHITYSDLGDVVMASKKGQFIRMALKDIKRLGRDTQGVTVMKLREGDKVASVALILPDDTEEKTPVQNSLDLTPPPAPKPAAPAPKIPSQAPKPATSAKAKAVQVPEELPKPDKKAEKADISRLLKAAEKDAKAQVQEKTVQSAPSSEPAEESSPEIQVNNYKAPSEDEDNTNYWGAQ